MHSILGYQANEEIKGRRKWRVRKRRTDINRSRVGHLLLYAFRISITSIHWFQISSRSTNPPKAKLIHRWILPNLIFKVIVYIETTSSRCKEMQARQMRQAPNICKGIWTRNIDRCLAAKACNHNQMGPMDASRATPSHHPQFLRIVLLSRALSMASWRTRKNPTTELPRKV